MTNILNQLKKYLLFPAQFWEHKNHEFLIEVAKILKVRNLDIKIYFCGKVENFKDKNYFLNLNKKITYLKLNNIIKNFGEVSLYKLNKMQNESFEKAEEELSFEDDYEDEYGLIFK